MTRREHQGGGACQSPKTTPQARATDWPAAPPGPDQLTSAQVPASWVTHLTCPTCTTPDALVLFDGVGTVCTECGEATRAITSYPDEEVSS